MTKEDLYIQFGPKLIGAVLTVLIKHINQLEKDQGTKPTIEQIFIDEIGTEIEQIPDYDWMSDESR